MLARQRSYRHRQIPVRVTEEITETRVPVTGVTPVGQAEGVKSDLPLTRSAVKPCILSRGQIMVGTAAAKEQVFAGFATSAPQGLV